MIAVTEDIDKNDPRILKGNTPVQILNQNGKFEKSPFAINRGNLKQVFTEQEFYTDKILVNKKFKELNQATFLDHNRPPLAEFKRGLKAIKIDEKLTPEQVRTEQFQPYIENGQVHDFMVFNDYAGRKIKLYWKDFDTHTKGDYVMPNKNRHQLFEHIKDVLTTPDELWINAFNVGKITEFVTKRYIKCYKKDVLVVDARLDNRNGWDLKTWYKYEEKMPETNLRKGLFINPEAPQKKKP